MNREVDPTGRLREIAADTDHLSVRADLVLSVLAPVHTDGLSIFRRPGIPGEV